MRSITLGNKELHITLLRSTRRTIQLKLLSPTKLEVRAPLTMTTDAICRFVESKQNRLLHHVAHFTLPSDRTKPPSHLILLGRSYPLQYQESDTLRLAQTKDGFLLSHPPAVSVSAIRTLLEDYYRQCARRVLTDKTAYWATRIGVTYNRIAIKSQKTRWGSCSAKGNLNYNWHIIAADEALSDYIVIHELCHLRHLNHSPAFWQLVAGHCPTYLDCRTRLRRQGSQYMSIL